MKFAERTFRQDKRLEEAISLLESHPNYPRVQVRMRDLLEEAASNAPPEAQAFGSSARLEYVLHRLDIQGEAFLELVSGRAMQNAYIVLLEHWEREAWDEFTGGTSDVRMLPASAQFEEYRHSIHARQQIWVKAGFQRLANAEQVPTSSPSDSMSNALDPVAAASVNSQHTQSYPCTTLQATRWEEIEISFLSDFQVEIQVGQTREVRNFAEFGLLDRRSRKPNRLWLVLRSLAELEGNISKPENSVRTWSVMEKRIQRLREFLQSYFNLPGDPLPFARGNGYQARFTICCRPSYKL